MQCPNTLRIALLAATMMPGLIWTMPVAAQVNDGCDVGGGANDISTLAAALTDTTLSVTIDLCANADAATKYQVYLDPTAPYATDADRNGDTVVDANDFCFPTEDATMKRAGQKHTGPGTSTVAGPRITFTTSFAELGIPAPAPVTPLLVWAATKRRATQDHAPTTEMGDGCSRPEFAQEVLTLPAAPVWSNDDLVTFRQNDWGGTPSGTNAAAILSNNYAAVYAPSFGILEVGIIGTGGFSMAFTTATNVLTYLPASGLANALNTDLLDPTSSASGFFGGDVVALRLNVDFSDAGLTGGTSSTPFGDVTLCGLTSLPAINGMTVRGFLATANTLLGGGSAPITIGDAVPFTAELNAAFLGGVPAAFAQDHLVDGNCP